MSILYFKTSNSTFVRKDEKLLSENYATNSYHIDTSSSIKYLISLIKLFIFLLTRGRKYKIYFIRFADWHTAVIAVFARIYKRKFIVVVGGYDVVRLPEYNYGAHINKFRSSCITYTFNNASYILPNHHALIKNVNEYASDVPIKGGILEFAPKAKNKIRVVYNGYNSSYWKSGGSVMREDMVISVAIVKNYRTFKIKGMDLLLEAAKHLPQFKFVVVGMSLTFIESNNIDIPDNVEVLNDIPQDKLLRFYNRAKVFCIPSRTEGMPNVLCESMLCGCIPVGSPVLAIPDIIGETGEVAKNNTPKQLALSIEAAFKKDFKDYASKARKRIIDNFSLEKRIEGLKTIINKCYNKN